MSRFMELNSIDKEDQVTLLQDPSEIKIPKTQENLKEKFDNLEKLQTYLKCVNSCLGLSLNQAVLNYDFATESEHLNETSLEERNEKKDILELRLLIMRLCLDFSPENLISQKVFALQSVSADQPFQQLFPSNHLSFYLMPTDAGTNHLPISQTMVMNETWVDAYYTLPLKKEISLVRSKIMHKQPVDDQPESDTQSQESSSPKSINRCVLVLLIVYNLIIMFVGLGLLVLGSLFLTNKIESETSRGIFIAMVVLGLLIFFVNMTAALGLLFKNKRMTYWGVIFKLVLTCTLLAFLLLYKKSQEIFELTRIIDGILMVSILVQCLVIYLIHSVYNSMS